MNINDIPFTLGVEEEYQIIHPETRDLHSYVQEFLEQGNMIFPEGQLKPEFMQSQIEVGSFVCDDIQGIRKELQRLRGKVGLLASNNGLAIAAASTHPFASWMDQSVTAGIRYKQLRESLGDVAAQLLIFGFHIHVGLGGPENNDLKMDVFNQLRYFLPHILALTTSSPFWQGRETGLKSYRSVVFEMLPRTGTPPSFYSFSEYEAFINIMGRAGTLELNEETGKYDATRIWWDMRPHPKFGTLEVRIADICTKIEEAVCVTALIQSLSHMIIKLRQNNQSWRVYRQIHLNENKWRAMRYGIDGKLIDFGKNAEVSMRDLVPELLGLVRASAEELGCWNEVQYMNTILEEGTSADRQLAVYQGAIKHGATEEDALKEVVDNLIKETMEGV